MTVGLLTVIALFAVVALARNGDGDEDSARTEAAVAYHHDEESDDDGDVGVEDADENDREEEGEGTADDGDDAALHRWRDKDENDREDDDEGRRGFAKDGWLPRDRIPAIKDWFADQGPDWEDSFGSPADLLDALVADGALTREQADALIARMEAQAERELGKLAEMGIISEEQIPDIADWLETQDATLKQGLEDPAGLLAAMVEDEVITQEQADAITELLAEHEGMEKRKHHRGGGDMLFDKLAAEGIISEDQLPAITAWIMEQEPDLAESFENPTEMLAAMAEDEVITQEQADAITELFAQHKEMKSDADGSEDEETKSEAAASLATEA